MNKNKRSNNSSELNIEEQLKVQKHEELIDKLYSRNNIFEYIFEKEIEKRNRKNKLQDL